MAHYIVQLAGKFLIWSTVVDSPITYGMTEPELKRWIRRESGAQGIAALPARMERVRARGTSSLIHEDAEETISGNRAGPNETELTVEEIIREYVTGPPTWSLPEPSGRR